MEMVNLEDADRIWIVTWEENGLRLDKEMVSLQVF